MEKQRFVLSLIKTNLKLRYRSSILGFLWTLINPLLILTIFTIIFTMVLTGMPVKKFPAFMMAGYLPWNFTVAAIINCTYSLTSHTGFINLIEIPKESFPVSEVFSQGISFILTLPILLLGMIYFKIPLTAYILWLPLIFIIQFILTLGICIICSYAYLYFRDLKQLLDVGLTLLFYATPIFYPITLVPEKFQIFYSLNPFSSLTISYQDVVIYGRNPGIYNMIFPLVLGLMILVSGYYYFVKLEDEFAEKI